MTSKLYIFKPLDEKQAQAIGLLYATVVSVDRAAGTATIVVKGKSVKVFLPEERNVNTGNNVTIRTKTMKIVAIW